jgi:hypothetical protein
LIQVIQGTPILNPENPAEEMIGVMPPKGNLKPDAADAFILWIMNGMPETAEDAAELSTTPETAATPAP